MCAEVVKQMHSLHYLHELHGCALLGFMTKPFVCSFGSASCVLCSEEWKAQYPHLTQVQLRRLHICGSHFFVESDTAGFDVFKTKAEAEAFLGNKVGTIHRCGCFFPATHAVKKKVDLIPARVKENV